MKTLKSILKYVVFVLLTFTFQQYVIAQKEEIKIVKLNTNFESSHCKARIEKAVSFEKGVKDVNADLATKTVTITYQTDKTTPEKLNSVVKDLGYESKIIDNVTPVTKQKGNSSK